jgi:hypothetical protein
MAYALGEFRLNVRGNAVGGEVWSNTWCFKDLAGGQDPQDVADILHGFYVALHGFANHIGNDTTSVGCTIRDLFNQFSYEADWATTTGTSGADLLPSQCAIRVSLTSATSNGGPFLAGYTISAVDSEGQFETSFRGDLVTALDNFTNALTAADWALRLDRPSVPATAEVTVGRVGERFDIIRKRANQQAEGYVTFGVG